jgi:4-hydroxythreonine-4-phosphate dehydrogenase
MSEPAKPIIAITPGDINGIGLEVILKTFVDERLLQYCTPVLYGSSRLVNYHRKMLGMQTFNYSQSRSIDRIQPHAFNIVNCWEEEIPLQVGSQTDAGGRYALLALQGAVADWKENKVQALVTAPINKRNIFSDSFPFRGHTAFLAQQAGVADYLMIMSSEMMRIGLVTEHVPITELASHITIEKVFQKIKLLHQSLQRDFGFTRPIISVLGLNPHAGDNGLIGNEDGTIITAAIAQAKEQGMLAYGPFAADGFFGSGRYQKSDGILAMYHDQGLIPFKTLCFSNGVNVTAGLPFVRTSPDHGVAYDIAGKNIANEESFRQAVFTALDIIRNRSGYAERNSNPLKKETISTVEK